MFRMFRIIRIIWSFRSVWSLRGERGNEGLRGERGNEGPKGERGLRAPGVRGGECQTFFMFETKALAVPNFRKRSMRMGMWRESSVT